MKLYLVGHNYRYAAEQILLMMFPSQRPEYPDAPCDGDRAVISLSRGEKLATAVCRLYLSGRRFEGRGSVPSAHLTDKLTTDRLLQRIIKQSFYRAALKSGVPKPEWGALTGIRPGKLVTNYLESGKSDTAAVSALCREYDASPRRARLCLHSAKAGLAVKHSLGERDICLYIGIPFCPTRCAYCSFVSHSVAKSMKLIEPFLEALFLEIAATAKVIDELGLNVISIYMGGGTPTTLSPEQLERLCCHVDQRFDLSKLREYTVEAGRPDTITEEKLAVLRAHGVDRVSVNPQTMEDHVLDIIGRRHTSDDILTALEKVRKTGGFAVNMDLIAGLPGDSPEGFSRTMDKVMALGAENITVHTLSLKKGSRIMLEGTTLPDAADVSMMLDTAMSALNAGGYRPYYLYRQKFMSGGFENVGWSKPGYDNLYNICIMEELCSIISMGGGASTKLVCSGTGRIERVFAPKYPQEYIAGIDKVISDKAKIKEFYNGIFSK